MVKRECSPRKILEDKRKELAEKGSDDDVKEIMRIQSVRSVIFLINYIV